MFLLSLVRCHTQQSIEGLQSIFRDSFEEFSQGQKSYLSHQLQEHCILIHNNCVYCITILSNITTATNAVQTIYQSKFLFEFLHVSTVLHALQTYCMDVLYTCTCVYIHVCI